MIRSILSPVKKLCYKKYYRSPENILSTWCCDIKIQCYYLSALLSENFCIQGRPHLTISLKQEKYSPLILICLLVSHFTIEEVESRLNPFSISSFGRPLYSLLLPAPVSYSSSLNRTSTQNIKLTYICNVWGLDQKGIGCVCV